MDLDIDRYYIIDNVPNENNDDFYDVYAVKWFGDIEKNDCDNECFACAKILQKELLYVVHITTSYKDYIQEVFGWDIEDSLNQALYSILLGQPALARYEVSRSARCW